MHEIIPGILEHEWSEIERKLELVRPFAKSVHVDIIDGKFADNLTFLDPEPFKKYSEDFILELHMMVDEPINYVKPFANAGFKRFIGHVEKMANQEEFVSLAKQYGEAGLALDGPTPIEEITVPLESLDTILVYTSERVGFSGPPFLPDRLKKVRRLREKTSILIEVDGGINNQTISMSKEAGADCFISTSYIFSTQNPQENFAKLNHLLGKNGS